MHNLEKSANHVKNSFLDLTMKKADRSRDATRRGERGQSLVEFAVLFPILLLMLAGIAEIGFMYITAYTVENASREGARMAVTLNTLETNDARVIGRVEDLIPATGFYTGFHGGTTNNGISDCSINDQVTVTVTGNYNFVALKLLGLTSIQLSFPTTMRYELCG